MHGDNLVQKERHPTKYRDEESRALLAEIRERYDGWQKANNELTGPYQIPTNDDEAIIRTRVDLFEEYKNFIDQQQYAEKFDSRSNLHSSVLEEFIYYLFRDFITEFGSHALIGKSHAFKDIFFAPPSYAEMLKRPYARIEKKDHDFVIGATYKASFDSTTPPEEDGKSEEGERTEEVTVENPVDYEDVAVSEDAETHLFDVPAVAIECKTYLDKSMLEGSSNAAAQIKARNPNGLYIVVSEWLKLTENVNLRKYQVDQIYVLRKQPNTDREFRYSPDYVKNLIDAALVLRLFNQVRTHLTKDWAAAIRAGLERGYLIE